MEAVVLAGGQGTRLRPHTSDLPKALVEVGGRPIVKILIDQLKKSGVTKIHMAVNHLSDKIISRVGDGSDTGLEIIYSSEEKPLSTVAPLKLLGNLPKQFIVVNGDILTDLDFRQLYDFHSEHDARLTVATYQRTEKIDYGVLSTDQRGYVTKFDEKPDYHFSVSMGVYMFSRSLLDSVPDNVSYGFDSLMHDLLKAGGKVATFPWSGHWMDIGRPSDYEQAKLDFENDKSS